MLQASPDTAISSVMIQRQGHDVSRLLLQSAKEVRAMRGAARGSGLFKARAGEARVAARAF